MTTKKILTMHHTLTKKVLRMENFPVEDYEFQIVGTRNEIDRKFSPIVRYIEFT